MKLEVRRARHESGKHQAWYVLIALASIADDLVTILTLGYFTSNLRHLLLFSEPFDFKLARD